MILVCSSDTKKTEGCYVCIKFNLFYFIEAG